MYFSSENLILKNGFVKHSHAYSICNLNARITMRATKGATRERVAPEGRVCPAVCAFYCFAFFCRACGVGVCVQAASCPYSSGADCSALCGFVKGRVVFSQQQSKKGQLASENLHP